MKNPFGKFLSPDKLKEMLSEKNINDIMDGIRDELRVLADELGKEVNQIKQSEKLKIVKNQVRQKTGMNSITAKIAMTAIDMFIKDKKSKYGNKFKINKDEFVKFITSYIQIGKETAAELFEVVKATFSEDFTFENTNTNEQPSPVSEKKDNSRLMELLRRGCADGDVDYVVRSIHNNAELSEVEKKELLEISYENGIVPLVDYFYSMVTSWDEIFENPGKYTSKFYRYCLDNDIENILIECNGTPEHDEIFSKFYSGHQFSITPGFSYNYHRDGKVYRARIMSTSLNTGLIEVEYTDDNGVSHTITLLSDIRCLYLSRIKATPKEVLDIFGENNTLPIEFLGDKCVVCGDYVVQYIDETQTILNLKEISYNV